MYSLDPESLTPIQRAELSVLAGLLDDNTLIDECMLDEEDFYDPMFGSTFLMMQQLRSERHKVEPVALGLLRTDWSAMFWQIPDLGEARHYSSSVAIVREWSTRRKLTNVAAGITQRAADATYDVGHLIEESRRQIALTAAASTEAIVSSPDVIASVVANVGKTIQAYHTPWPQLTGLLHGFRKGGLYIVGARPGVGKSALALQMAALLEHFGNVGFFTLEMPKEEVTTRLISQEVQVSHDLFGTGHPLPTLVQEQISDWLKTYPGHLLFNDQGTITMPQIRAQIRAWVADESVPLVGIVVDYLQLISGPGHMTKLQLVTEISRELKLIARDFDIPVIALSQLNRNSEGRVDKKPNLADLRESGSIEQDADVVLLLYRPDEEDKSRLELIVAKSRQGPLGSVDLEWQGEFMRAVA